MSRTLVVQVGEGGRLRLPPEVAAELPEGTKLEVSRGTDGRLTLVPVGDPANSRAWTAEELAGPSLLSELAEQTGGRHFPVDNLNELPDVAAKIGIELHNQYVLGYAPSNREKDGKYRHVQVKLVQPKGLPPLRAFWRLGYYAPTQ